MIAFVNILGGIVLFSPTEDGKNDIVFAEKNGVSIGFVPEEFIGAVERKKCGCCWHGRPQFRRATEAEIQAWQKTE